jgi:Secretion system C-terminal sorting domain
MKKQLQKIIYTCLTQGIAVIIMIFSFEIANAQIIYTDIIPDTILSNPGNYNLDLNNDGQNDFVFSGNIDTLICGPGPCRGIVSTSKVTPGSLSWVADTINVQAGKFDSGDLINASTSLWSNTPNQAIYIKTGSCGGQCSGIPPSGSSFVNGATAGLWNNVADKYIALKIQVSGSIYYGWVRLDVGTNGYPIKIKDYAYNSIPNLFILAGDTGTGPTGIIENKALSIYLFPNPATNHLTIAFGSNNKNVEVTITDISGKIIYSTTASETQQIEVNTKDFAKGIYVVQIQAADFIATKKLIVVK